MIAAREMIIFEKYKLLERLIGLRPFGGWESTFVRTIYLAAFISINIMELMFIIWNIDDGVEVAAPALAPLAGAFTALACYGHLLINLDRYRSLLNELQDIVNNSA